MKNIPLIIPVFNQLTFLKNIINWWRWYYPENKIYIIDNNSTYEPLLAYYDSEKYDLQVVYHKENNCPKNLYNALNKIELHHEYYCISDPDIMIHPSTPPNFLEIFKHCLDNYGLQRVGFGLITDDIPDWLEEKIFIQTNEKEFQLNQQKFSFKDKEYLYCSAPLDTTFSMFKSTKGWYAPMSGSDWSNCWRMFKAFHLGWYQHPDYVNSEMDYYFRHAKFRDFGAVSAGKNNNRPNKYQV